MNKIRKALLKRKYLNKQNKINKLMEPYNCGIYIASFINPKIGKLEEELKEIEEKVHKEIEIESNTK